MSIEVLKINLASLLIGSINEELNLNMESLDSRYRSSNGDQPSVSSMLPTLEIMQVALIESNKKDCYRTTSESITLNLPLKLSLYIKKKHHCHQAAQNDLTLFSFKVTSNEDISFLAFIKEQCMPLLHKLVRKMQELEKESHLAIQTIDENSNEINKTFVLWLEDYIGQHNAVKILRERAGSRDTTDDICTVLQLRVLFHINDITQCGINIFDLIERIKMMNPLIHLYFYMDIGVVTELKLCDSQILRCAGYDIYKGPEVFMRKLIGHFVAGNIQICCSEKFKMNPLSCDVIPLKPFMVSCISCFVPIFASKELTDHEIQNYKIASTTGKLNIHVYGPNSLPLDMNLVFETNSLYPHDLLSWQKFGLQVKKKTTCSPYKLESLVRQTSKEVLPSWASTCHHFVLLLIFIVEPEDSFTMDKGDLIAEVKLKKELLDKIEKVCLTHDALKNFQKAALSSMSQLFGQRIQPGENPVQTLTVPELNGDLAVHEKSDLFVKMIPEVVNSLVDIFTRSTNTDFRAEVSALVPTGSRVTMSSHLQEKLWKVMEYPKCKMKNVDILPNMAPICNPQTSTNAQLSSPEVALADAIDDWDISDDSLCSNREGPMSPDSLDIYKDCEDEEFVVSGEFETCIDNSPTLHFSDEQTSESNSVIQNTSSNVESVIKKSNSQHEPTHFCEDAKELNCFQIPSVAMTQRYTNGHNSHGGELSHLNTDRFGMNTSLQSELNMKTFTSEKKAHELECTLSHQKATVNMTLNFSSLSSDLLMETRARAFEQQITSSSLTSQSALQNCYRSHTETLDFYTVSNGGSSTLSDKCSESTGRLSKKRSADFDGTEKELSSSESQDMGPELESDVCKRKKPSHQCQTHLSQNIPTASSQNITSAEKGKFCSEPMSNSADPHTKETFQHVGESGWFDEDELSKWYAEMED